MNKDCLHCLLKPTIDEYCDRHPEGDMGDIFTALADVIGDLLTFDKYAPRQAELFAKVTPWIEERIKYGEEELSKRR